MAKYRKKPVVIEAEGYKAGMEDGFDYGYFEDGKFKSIDYMSRKAEEIPYIDTLEGRMLISEGDYIITGIKGERYPCKPDIFEATYELVV